MSLHDRKLDSRGMPHPKRAKGRAQSTSVAAVLLLVLGLLQMLQGLAALLSDDFYESPKGYVLGSDMITSWGWTHLLLGVAAAATGWALRRRAMWARGVAVSLVTLSMFANFLWIPLNPLGAGVFIALDVFVLWAAFADYDRDAP